MAGRTWLAVILCFLVWWVYTKFFLPPPPPMSNKQIGQSAPQSPGSTQQSVAAGSNALPGSTSSAGASSTAGSPFSRFPQFDETYVFEGKKVKIHFTKWGGRIHAVTLNEYGETVKDDSPRISPVNQENFPFTYSAVFSEAELSDLNFGEYKFEVTDVASDSENQLVDGTSASKLVSFTRQSPSGVRVTKEYRLSEQSYAAQLSFQVEFPKSSRSSWGQMWIPVGSKGLEYSQSIPIQAWESVAYLDDTLEQSFLDSLEEKEQFRGNVHWLAFGNRYFSSVVLNESRLNPDVVMFGESDRFYGGLLQFPLQTPKDSSALDFKFTLYTGPKDYAELSKFTGLTRLVSYGWVSFLAHPLLALLKLFYGFCHNYGLAIILLTILVRGAFYPLTAKSMKSMKSMQKLSPQLKALKEKYKDDRERFNREQIALFKAHKVNPAAGCLPMLIQLPVFIALYQVLANAMELFHAPFFGWIQDLSTKDPYYVYPILMGITMLIQQKITPNAGMDPTQQKIMYIMPVVFTFIMLQLPSGLTLYIFVSTLLGILQQYFMTRDPSEQAVSVKAKSAPQKS